MLSLETSVGWLGASCIGVDYVTNINMKYSSLVNHMRTFPIPRMVFMHPSSFSKISLSMRLQDLGNQG